MNETEKETQEETQDEVQEQPSQGLMSEATEEEKTTEDEGMSAKEGETIVEGENIDGVEFERPDTFPEKFWHETEGPDVEALAKSYTQLEKKLHGGDHKAPKEYALDALKEKGYADDDPVVQTFAEWSKNNNISQDSFDELATKIAEMNGEVARDAEISVEQEKKKLGENADSIIKSNVQWGKSLISKGVLSNEDYQELEVWGGTAEGQRLLNKFRSMMGEREIPAVSVSGQGMDEDELKSLVADPRYASDPVFRKKVERDFEEFYNKR